MRGGIPLSKSTYTHTHAHAHAHTHTHTHTHRQTGEYGLAERRQSFVCSVRRLCHALQHTYPTEGSGVAQSVCTKERHGSRRQGVCASAWTVVGVPLKSPPDQLHSFSVVRLVTEGSCVCSPPLACMYYFSVVQESLARSGAQRETGE